MLIRVLNKNQINNKMELRRMCQKSYCFHLHCCRRVSGRLIESTNRGTQ